jgi:hypothetical protein
MRDATHISIIIDRSGSMEPIRHDAEGAINHFLSEQQKVEGDCSLLLADFDGEDPFHVIHDGPLGEFGQYRLSPRGNTPLRDAVGRMLIVTGLRLEGLSEDYRPDKVIIVIQTDGQENASREYTWEQLTAKIKTQTEVYNWQFIFLGMGADSWDQGTRLGVQNIVRSAGTGAAHVNTYDTMSTMSTAYRGGMTHDMAGMRVTVDSAGKVFNEAGEEIDPKTGKVATA